MTSNLYDVLGVERTATPFEIKVAYRKQALIWHPDRNKMPTAHSRFIELQEAYKILNDSQLRRTYDQTLDSVSSLNRSESFYEKATKTGTDSFSNYGETYNSSDDGSIITNTLAYLIAWFQIKLPITANIIGLVVGAGWFFFFLIVGVIPSIIKFMKEFFLGGIVLQLLEMSWAGLGLWLAIRCIKSIAKTKRRKKESSRYSSGNWQYN